MSKGSSPAARRLLLSPDAVEVYHSVDNRENLASLNRALDVLTFFPEAGHAYDPLFDAARPPFEVLEFLTRRYGIYYSYLAEQDMVYVRFIEDLRRDPQGRFGNSHPV